ncbi:hypothetical protein GGR52DRAFT_573167 [Hypoxylon sp. FL1284]|nr:hypothetical protein GGR52DRAFT_573167 [Hypoxylon sp. FL1284]
MSEEANPASPGAGEPGNVGQEENSDKSKPKSRSKSESKHKPKPSSTPKPDPQPVPKPDPPPRPKLGDKDKDKHKEKSKNKEKSRDREERVSFRHWLVSGGTGPPPTRSGFEQMARARAAATRERDDREAAWRRALDERQRYLDRWEREWGPVGVARVVTQLLGSNRRR